MKKNIFVISEVQATHGISGGQVLLARHFDALNDYEYTPIATKRRFRRPFGSIFEYLYTTRLQKICIALLPLLEVFSVETINETPDAVITVAHGRTFRAAQAEAKKRCIPLIVFFHDWYPASNGGLARFNFFWTREYRKLYKAADLALCVSPQMLEKLGEHPNAIVLSPIPSRADTISTTPSLHARLLYFGLCSGAYTSPLQQLVCNMAHRDETFTVVGKDALNLKLNSENVVLKDFILENEFGSVFNGADILVLLINFDPSKKIHFETHFPSKLVEYTGKGKFIAIWSPEYSSSVQWARENETAFYYCKNDAAGFLDGLKQAYDDIAFRQKTIANSMSYYESNYSPEILNRQFAEALSNLFDKNITENDQAH